VKVGLQHKLPKSDKHTKTDQEFKVTKGKPRQLPVPFGFYIKNEIMWFKTRWADCAHCTATIDTVSW